MITTADNTQFYVKDWGSGQPVILLHGWPRSADSWDDAAIAFVQSGFRTIAYDRRGFGRSSQPWSGYDCDTLADDLSTVIELCGATDAILVGFSTVGGEVARYMPRHNGKAVSKVALVSSVVPYMLKTADNPLGTAKATFDGVAQALKEDRASFFVHFFKDFFGVGLVTRPVSEQVLEWVWNLSMQASLQAKLECAKSFSTTNFRHDMAAFKLPTLIIQGTEDKTLPIEASGRAAAAGVARSTLIEYEGAPHGLFATAMPAHWLAGLPPDKLQPAHYLFA